MKVNIVRNKKSRKTNLFISFINTRASVSFQLKELTYSEQCFKLYISRTINKSFILCHKLCFASVLIKINSILQKTEKLCFSIQPTQS